MESGTFLLAMTKAEPSPNIGRYKFYTLRGTRGSELRLHVVTDLKRLHKLKFLELVENN